MLEELEWNLKVMIIIEDRFAQFEFLRTHSGFHMGGHLSSAPDKSGVIGWASVQKPQRKRSQEQHLWLSDELQKASLVFSQS